MPMAEGIEAIRELMSLQAPRDSAVPNNLRRVFRKVCLAGRLLDMCRSRSRTQAQPPVLLGGGSPFKFL